jgi:hypothetical protein
MATVNNINNKCWQECGEKRNFYLGENANYATSMEINMEIPQKTENRTTT